MRSRGIPTPTQKKQKASRNGRRQADTGAPGAEDGGSWARLARLQPASDAQPEPTTTAGDCRWRGRWRFLPPQQPPRTARMATAGAAPQRRRSNAEEARESPTNAVAAAVAPPAENDGTRPLTSLELQVASAVRHRDGRRFLREGAAVTLRREANEHDANAIEAWIPGELLAPVQPRFLRRGPRGARAFDRRRRRCCRELRVPAPPPRMRSMSWQRQRSRPGRSACGPRVGARRR